MNTLSIVKGVPLEQGLASDELTIPGFLLEMTEVFADREAIVFHESGERISWSYRDLRAQAESVARALIASGVGKGSRVGIMMTNRPEWAAAFFGVGLAGGIAVPLSTFSTAPELAYLLQSSGVSFLALEPNVARNDLLAAILELEPQLARPGAGQLQSLRFPFLRDVVVLGEPPEGSRVLGWKTFLARGDAISAELMQACAMSQLPSDIGAIFFSSGSTSTPKGVINAHRGIVLQFHRQAFLLGLAENVRAWTPNGFFWSGNCAQVLGATLAVGGAVEVIAFLKASLSGYKVPRRVLFFSDDEFAYTGSSKIKANAVKGLAEARLNS